MQVPWLLFSNLVGFLEGGKLQKSHYPMKSNFLIFPVTLVKNVRKTTIFFMFSGVYEKEHWKGMGQNINPMINMKF